MEGGGLISESSRASNGRRNDGGRRKAENDPCLKLDARVMECGPAMGRVRRIRRGDAPEGEMMNDCRTGFTRNGTGGDREVQHATESGLPAKTTTTSPIHHFELRYHLHPGLGDALASLDWTEHFSATRAGLAFALDKCDYECLLLRGSYGAAGAAVYAIMRDGEVAVTTDEAYDCVGDNHISEAHAHELLLSDGELDSDAVHGLRVTVWDGNNHVAFTPARSLRLLSGEAAYERIGHALVRWNDDGGIDNMRFDEGWSVADEYYATLGNAPWSHGDRDRTADERRSSIVAAGIECDLVWLSGDDVAILVPTDKLEPARAALRAD